jgi:hypothetical protein
VTTLPKTLMSRSLSAVLVLVLGLAAVGACANPAAAERKPYTPERGQPGKDVMWIPTPQGLIDRMLEMGKVTSRDVLFDLGAGDGIIPITAARRFGTTGVGIEYNPQMAEFARSKVAEAGVADKVRIITGDIFKEDFSSATVVTLYLFPDLNMRLRPQLLAMKPGTRVVSHAFNMGDWEPDATVDYGAARAYLWTVPARVEGDWRLRIEGVGETRLRLEQTFQQVGGVLSIGDTQYALVGAKLEGQELRFKIITAGKEVQEFRLQVSGSRLEGTLSAANMNAAVQGSRR